VSKEQDVTVGRADDKSIVRIDHVAVAVHDLEASLGYYTTRLGLSLVHREEQPHVGVRVAFLDGGNTLLQLVQPVRPGPVQEFLSERGEGLHHICLAVDDIPSALAQLSGSDTAITVGAWSRRACFLQDEPNGVRIELTELAPAHEVFRRSTGSSTP
jgi:methylmalonyl-CoA/ethylmalonyl-CoA epimerase